MCLLSTFVAQKVHQFSVIKKMWYDYIKCDKK